MGEKLTKNDLHQFGDFLLGKIRIMIEQEKVKEEKGITLHWLKGRMVRKILDISPGSLQNLRITGKVRFRKVLGSYYYNKADVDNLFNDQTE